MTKILAIACFIILFVGLTAPAQQSRPDFSGTWLLDATHSGPEPEIWLQRRPVRFIIHQSTDEMTIDTGDGSLFGVPAPVTETALRYRLDGSVVTVPDRSMGEIPNFARKISTEASWEGNSSLLTFTTHFSETPKGMNSGNTRVLIFSIYAEGRQMKVDRTGYRGPRPDLSTLFASLPKYLHNGRIEDDRVYAKDTAFYTKVVP